MSKPQRKPRLTLPLAARLDRVRRHERLTENRFAEVLGMSKQQYYNMKAKSQRVTKAWEIALKAMEQYGLDFLMPKQSAKKK